ncbi:MAG: hypothetical protein ACKOZW_10920 [Cyanobium sp.]
MPAPLLLTACGFDKSPTPPVLALQALVLAATAAGLWLVSRWRDRAPLRFGLMGLGVLIFQLFTAPMWNNDHLGPWAYLYRDVSWVLTLAWTTLFLVVVEAIDRLRPRWRAWRRFLLALGLITVVALPVELLLVQLGVRSYAPEVLAAVGPWRLAGVPLEFLYYVPVFAALVLGFYRYWSFVLDDALLIPVLRIRWWRGLALTAVAVLLFELMVEPMVENRGFPAWSMLHRDVSLLMSGVWVLVIALTAALVVRLGATLPIALRFLLALAIATAIALPIEYGLVAAGVRVYGPSATANFSGFTIPLLQAPVEIAFAIPCYLALVIAFIRYWEIVLDNRL